MMLRSLVPAVTISLLLGAAAPGNAAHPHYLRLLREGSLSLEQGDAEEASRSLRLACFGLLEEPPLLAECLMRLGLAQAAADDTTGFDETFRRVVELEQRFGAYRAADVPPDLRASFEDALERRVTDRALRTSGVFADLAEPDPELVPEPPEPELDGAEGTTPTPPEEIPAGEGVERPAPTAGELGAAERAQLERARELLEQARRRGDLEEPYRMARRIADAHPDLSEAQRLTAVVAYRYSLWEDAVRYFRRGNVVGGDRPQLLFYYAVSLYEAGQPEEAVEPLRRSLPHLQQTPFVQSYREKILKEPRPPVP